MNIVKMCSYLHRSIIQGLFKEREINFLPKFKLYIVWNWFMAKIILILQKCFEAIQNGSKSTCSRLEEQICGSREVQTM